MKTIVFAYHDFGCIGTLALLRAGYDIVKVFTHADDPREAVYFRSVAVLCAERGIPVYAPEKPPVLDEVDYIFSFYYRHLLPDAVLSRAKKGAFNLHGSFLPKYRGRACINWVLVNGETETGVTLHHMVARADAGDIVAQARVPIAYEDTALTLQQKMVRAAEAMLDKQLPLIAKGKAARIQQDLSQGAYFGRRTPTDGQIHWDMSAEAVRNLVRAVTHPYPGAFTHAGGKKLFVWQVEVKDARGEPGTVLSLNPFVVACGDGALVIKVAQIEGGICVSGAQAAAELSLFKGAML